MLVISERLEVGQRGGRGDWHAVQADAQHLL
jgi:hypothetical protein